MAKKRQLDFQKTQLKPGRTIARRKNVTNTAFKSKKIAVPGRGSKPRLPSAKTIPNCLKLLKDSSHHSAKIAALEELNKLIHRNPESLPTFLSDILGSVLKFTLETDDTIRCAAIEIIICILTSTDDLQIQSFVSLFINTLSCGMTHSNMKVKEYSLWLLKSLLKYHPNLISHSTTVLNNLFQMLVGIPRTRTSSQILKMPKSSLPVIYADDIFSPDWRIHILGHINLFLKEILKKKNAAVLEGYESSVQDEQEVYWDCEGILNVPIYAGSGLKPFDVEKCYTSIATDELGEDSEEEISTFLAGIIHTVPMIFMEEISTESKFDDRLLPSSAINDLHIIFQVLCSVSDFLQLVKSKEIEKELRIFLMDFVYDKGLFPFSQRGTLMKKEKGASACVQLNLAVCYLFCKELLNFVENKDSLNETIFSYVKRVFNYSYEVKHQSVPLLVKITKFYFLGKESIEVSDFLHDVLCHLCALLKVKNDHPNRALLTSVFTKMSLDSGYHFIAQTDAMKDWFSWLLSELQAMCRKNNVNKNLLKVIKKISNRRYPHFQKLLDKANFCYMKELLQYDDDDVRDTAIFLIYHMGDLNHDYLTSIAHFILRDLSFPRLFAVRLIRLLTYRFSEEKTIDRSKPSIHDAAGMITIVQFLLNIAIDSFNIHNKKFTDFETNEYTKAAAAIKDAMPFRIVPSLHWKEHSKLFDVCYNFLNQLPSHIVNKATVILFENTLKYDLCLPMHTAIAIMKLNNSDLDKMRAKYHKLEICDLIFTSLLTVSVLTSMPIAEDWAMYNVEELLNSISLTKDLALETLRHIEFMKEGISSIAVYHMLRVCKFYFRKLLLDQKHSPIALKTLNILKDKCLDKTIAQQPLFVFLYEQLSYCM